MNLIEGDVLIEGDDGHYGGKHALMWVGGEKPLVHSSNAKFLGGFAQSMGYIEKSMPTRSEGLNQTDAGVYRYTGGVENMAKEAARFGRAWSTEITQIESSALAQIGATHQAVLRTPFSYTRHGNADLRRTRQDDGPISIEAIFRVVKAIARTEEKLPLSPNHGVSCSQFVVFCYQAAALSLKFGGTLPKNVVASLRGDRRKDPLTPTERLTGYVMAENLPQTTQYWRDEVWWAEQGMFRKAKDLSQDQDAVSLVNMALNHNQTSDYYKSLLPVGMDIDPLSYGVQYLLKRLKDHQSSFTYQGQLNADIAGGKVTWTIERRRNDPSGIPAAATVYKTPPPKPPTGVMPVKREIP